MNETNNKNGCTFGKITRERVDNFIDDFNKFVTNDFAHLSKDVKKFAQRPTWLITAVIIAMSNIIAVLLALHLGGG